MPKRETLILIQSEGVICDTITYKIGEDGTHVGIRNHKQNWQLIHDRALVFGCQIERHLYDGSVETSDWFDSEPYKYRKNLLDANQYEVDDVLLTLLDTCEHALDNHAVRVSA